MLSLLRSELSINVDEPYRVLLVDDDSDLLDLYKSSLTEAGYIVTTAMSAEEALMLLEHDQPELALIDVQMPGCSGIELGRLIRLHEEFAHIPLLFMSIDLSARDIQRPVFLQHLKLLITNLSLSPASVVLEITETVLLADWPQAAAH